MKKIILFALTVTLCLSISVPAMAAYDPERDYMAAMLDAVAAGDVTGGYAAEQMRNEKIDKEETGHLKVAFEDLQLLSKVIYQEAGSNWLSETWKMSVGEVVLNRVASGEFPNTVREVVMQPGQYGGNTRYFRNLQPSRLCAEIALRLLCGERVLNEPSVVFQSNGTLGSGVFKKLTDSTLGTTYLCYSSHPEQY